MFVFAINAQGQSWLVNNGLGIFSSNHFQTSTFPTGDFSFSIGLDSSANGTSSVAMGYSSIADNFSAVALGSDTFANGIASTALGDRTLSSGDYGALAAGLESIASGNSSSAFGIQTQAIGEGSTSTGGFTLASGIYSLAGGDSSQASGNYSSAFGIHTVADGWGTTAIGTFNDINEDNINVDFSLDNTAFVIGNGWYDNNQGAYVRSNALEVLFDGTTTIAGDLNINSDSRLKANIISLGATLSKLLQIDGKSYTMKKDANNKKKIGLLAQDIEKVFPELVTETKNIKSVNYQGLVPVIINAMKEQQKQITQQQKEIDELKTMVIQLTKE